MNDPITNRVRNAGNGTVFPKGMEISMNAVDWILLGEAKLLWWTVPLMLLAGFLTPLPYNYWRLKKFNVSCH